ncbi:unnamed protein product, partial [Staurois parvus]
MTRDCGQYRDDQRLRTHNTIASLAVFPSVARGKVSIPQAVTPSYTQAYHAALLRDPFCTYLVLRSRDVPPAVSPA